MGRVVTVAVAAVMLAACTASTAVQPSTAPTSRHTVSVPAGGEGFASPLLDDAVVTVDRWDDREWVATLTVDGREAAYLTADGDLLVGQVRTGRLVRMFGVTFDEWRDALSAAGAPAALTVDGPTVRGTAAEFTAMFDTAGLAPLSCALAAAGIGGFACDGMPEPDVETVEVTATSAAPTLGDPVDATVVVDVFSTLVDASVAGQPLLAAVAPVVSPDTAVEAAAVELASTGTLTGAPAGLAGFVHPNGDVEVTFGPTVACVPADTGQVRPGRC